MNVVYALNPWLNAKLSVLDLIGFHWVERKSWIWEVVAACVSLLLGFVAYLTSALIYQGNLSVSQSIQGGCVVALSAVLLRVWAVLSARLPISTLTEKESSATISSIGLISVLPCAIFLGTVFAENSERLFGMGWYWLPLFIAAMPICLAFRNAFVRQLNQHVSTNLSN